MTVQIGDIYKYNGRDYSCIERTGYVFNPYDYGLQPSRICSDCMRGYWCEYEITNNRIMLQSLHIHDADEIYPTINYVSISSKDHMPASAQTDEGLDSTEIPFSYEYETYEHLGLLLPYTGKLLLGIPFLQYSYFYHSSECKELLCFEFDNGELKNVEDYSETAHTLHKAYKKFGLREFADDEELYEKLPEGFRKNIWWWYN